MKNKKKYLTEVFPCKKSEYMQRKMRIMVDPKVYFNLKGL